MQLLFETFALLKEKLQFLWSLDREKYEKKGLIDLTIPLFFSAAITMTAQTLLNSTVREANLTTMA